MEEILTITPAVKKKLMVLAAGAKGERTKIFTCAITLHNATTKLNNQKEA